MDNERDNEREPEGEQQEENNRNDQQQNDDDQNDQQQRPQPQPQQGRYKKCPRCESFNTKFCYYNNYNLSQPRYFCKACKRYWTHGGTLRNVPVGGGCRKPKRGRPSTSTAANPKPPPPPPTMPSLHAAKPILPTLPSISTNGNMFASLGYPSYFQNGTYVSSLVGNQSVNNLEPSFNQVPVTLGNGASNMAMLQGFNNPQNNFNITQPNQPANFFDVGGGQAKTVAYDQSLTNSQLLNGRANDSWQQNFVNSAPVGMWSFDHGGVSNSSKNVNNTVGSASFDPNQWFDLPGFGPHPP